MKSINQLIPLIKRDMKRQNFDSVAVSLIDFNDSSYESYDSTSGHFFDLASLTKPLTLAATFFLVPDSFDHDLKLLLNHRAGIPSWGRLSHNNWKEQVLSYPIKESSAATYSDFSALQLMLELEKKHGKAMKDICSSFYDEELVFWKDLPEYAVSPFTGFRNNDLICGEVNDDNCFVINEFTTHAGLFATIDGISKSLLNLNSKTSFVDKMKSELLNASSDQRFVNGWDRVLNSDTTLAGIGAAKSVFGHLGFTGTSIWIDSETKKGHIILTNATQNYWHERAGLNELRRMIGSYSFN